MRDIGARLDRYRLSRYATPQKPWRRHLRWVILVVAAWMLWAGVISDHSFYRLWRLEREAAREREQLGVARAEVLRLSADLDNAKTQRFRAERALRVEQGMAGKNEIIYRFEENLPDSLRR